MKMKSVLLVFMAFGICNFGISQEDKKPKVKNLGDLTEVTYYHDNGQIAQQGTYNKQGKLEGIWTSYDENGNKTMVGEYNDNKKVGNWLIWSSDVLKEVEYKNSRIVKVSKWLDKVQVANN
ncbi:MAG: nicotinic acid mononucleotide adenyltransferase [Bacteroidota bacterium]